MAAARRGAISPSSVNNSNDNWKQNISLMSVNWSFMTHLISSCDSSPWNNLLFVDETSLTQPHGVSWLLAYLRLRNNLTYLLNCSSTTTITASSTALYCHSLSYINHHITTYHQNEICKQLFYYQNESRHKKRYLPPGSYCRLSPFPQSCLSFCLFLG